MTIAYLNRSLRRDAGMKTKIEQILKVLCKEVSVLEAKAGRLRIALNEVNTLKEQP